MKSIKHLIHPYIFVLKEGSEIEKNRLDYSLMMLKIGPMEYFPSPQVFDYEVKKDPSLSVNGA